MITSKNTAAVVVWYRPTEQQKQNPEHYRQMVDRIYIVDNTEHNRGIGAALNDGLRQAMADGYEWVLTMDQDSVLDANLLRRYMDECNAYEQFDRVGIFSVRQSYGNTIKERARYEEQRTVMCSGNLVSRQAIELTGGMREELFIDSVDDDFCIRVHRAGLQVVTTNRILMEHHLGEGMHRTRIFRHKYLVHPALRHYYIMRNMLYLYHDYPEHRDYYGMHIRKRIKRLLLYDRHNKWAKIRAEWLGWRDYKKGVTGKCPHSI